MSNIIEPGGEPEEPIITADALLSLLAVPFQSIGQLVGDIQTEIDQQLGSVLREIQQDQYIIAAQITDKLVQPLKAEQELLSAIQTGVAAELGRVQEDIALVELTAQEKIEALNLPESKLLPGNWSAKCVGVKMDAKPPPGYCVVAFDVPNFKKFLCPSFGHPDWDATIPPCIDDSMLPPEWHPTGIEPPYELPPTPTPGPIPSPTQGPTPSPTTGPTPSPAPCPICQQQCCVCPEPEPKGWIAYKRTPPYIGCYAKKVGESPEEATDKIIGTGSTKSEALNDGYDSDECGDTQDDNTERKIDFSIFGLCEPEAYNSLTSYGGEIANFAQMLTLLTGPLGIPLGFDRIISPIANAVNNIIKEIPCASIKNKDLLIARCVVDLIATVIPSLKELSKPLWYATQRNCANEFPDAMQATQAFLANAIDSKTYEAWVTINNKCFEPNKAVQETMRSKLVPDQLVMALSRQLINNKQYAQGMRSIGYTREQDWQTIYDLSEQLPPIQDLIHFMVRDVADDVGKESVVQKFNLDDDFDEKWQGQLKEFGEKQHINEDFAKFAWRAHWIIPGPQQLAEMLHRLGRKPKGDPLRVDIETVRTALKQQDIAPFWVDKLIEISYQPLTRIDLRRAFDIGAIDKKQVHDGYLDLGYDDKRAGILADFTEELRVEGIQNEAPLKMWRKEIIDKQEARQRLIDDNFTPEQADQGIKDAERDQENHSAVTLFRQQKITRQKAEQLLRDHGIGAQVYKRWLDNAAMHWETHPILKQFKVGMKTWQQVTDVLTAAGVGQDRLMELRGEMNDEMDYEIALTCAKAIKERFLIGDMDQNDARIALQGLGINPERANIFIGKWVCERDARGKLAPASMLCGWLDLGLIGAVEFSTRLQRLGWDADDAAMIIAQCQAKLGARRAKEMAKQVKDNAAALARAAREAAREGKQVAAEIRKNQEQAKKRKANEKRRRDRLFRAASKYAKSDSVDFGDAFDTVTNAKKDIQAEYVLTVDQAIQAVLLAAENPPDNKDIAFVERAGAVAQDIVESEAAVANNGQS